MPRSHDGYELLPMHLYFEHLDSCKFSDGQAHQIEPVVIMNIVALFPIFFRQILQESVDAKSVFEKDASAADIASCVVVFEDKKKLYALECRNVSLEWWSFYAFTVW